MKCTYVCKIRVEIYNNTLNLFHHYHMKKTFFIILLAVCFVSCKKEQHTNAPLKKYKLSFDVSGFTQTTGPFTPNSQRKITNSTTDTLSAFVDKLVYRLYDSKQKGDLLSHLF